MLTTQNLIRPKAANHTVTLNEVAGGYVFTNEGAGALITFTLPNATANQSVSFIVENAFGLTITAAGGDTINGAASMTSTTVGDVIELTCINATEWMATLGTQTGGGGGADVSVRARVTVPQSIPQGAAPTLITFGGEDFDTDNMHDNAVNTERITINTPGKYEVGANVVVDTTTNPGGTINAGSYFNLILNGTTVIGGGSIGAYFTPGLNEASGGGSTIYELVAGDYIEVYTTGQNVGPHTVNTNSSFRAHKIN